MLNRNGTLWIESEKFEDYTRELIRLMLKPVTDSYITWWAKHLAERNEVVGHRWRKVEELFILASETLNES